MRSSIAALTLLTLTTGVQADPLVQREFSGRDNRFIEMPGAGFRAMASGKRISFDAQGMSIDLPGRVAELRTSRGRTQLLLSERWAQDHPRTLHLLHEDCRRWQAQAQRRIDVVLG